MDTKKKKTGALRLIKTAAFLLILVLLLHTGSLLLMPKENTKAAGVRAPMTKNFHGEPENTLDYIALGNSNFYRSIAPIGIWNQYGYAGVVAASPGVKMSELYYMYKDVLTCQKPKLIIVEAGAAFDLKKKDGREPDRLKSMAKYPSGELGSFDDGLATELNQLIPMLQYHSRWKSLTPRDLDLFNPPDYSKRDPNKGTIIDVTKKPYKKGNYMKNTGETAQMHIADRMYLDKILRLAKETGSQVLLMEVPDGRSWDYKRHNAAAQYAKENGVPFLDLNLKLEEVGIDWNNDTKDGGEHMNLYGMRKVTNYLGTYLSNAFDLPDRRENPAYRHWDTDAKQYEKNVNKKIQANPKGVPVKKPPVPPMEKPQNKIK